MGSGQSAPTTAAPRPSSSSSSSSANKDSSPGKRYYDAIDRMQAQLPHVIDAESQQQVDDYKQACNNGKGPMVACFATAEFISLYELKHEEAAQLYHNTCFRPKSDKSPNGVLMKDGTKAYPAGCFNLAKLYMTGKASVVPVDRAQAYQLLDRACLGGHGGACYLQAQVLLSAPGSLGPNVPHDPQKAMDLYQQTCDAGDSVSCFTLATMLLRGERISKDATNVSPQEARGQAAVVQRQNEANRARYEQQDDYVIQRDPPRAAKLLTQACEVGANVTACHNLAVMYSQGDDGVEPDETKADYFKKKTQERLHLFGGFGNTSA